MITDDGKASSIQIVMESLYTMNDGWAFALNIAVVRFSWRQRFASECNKLLFLDQGST